MRTGYNHTKALLGVILGLLFFLAIAAFCVAIVIVEIAAGLTLLDIHNGLGGWLLAIATGNVLMGAYMIGKAVR